jgi:hypothetical protein
MESAEYRACVKYSMGIQLFEGTHKCPDCGEVQDNYGVMSTILSLNVPHRIAINSDGFAFVTAYSSTVIKLNLKVGSYANFATIPTAQLIGAAFDKDGTLIVCSESQNLIHYLGKNGKLLKSLPVNSPRDIMIASNGIV